MPPEIPEDASSQDATQVEGHWIILVDANASVTAVAEALSGLGLKVDQVMDGLHMIAVHGSADAILKAQRIPGVTSVELSQTFGTNPPAAQI